MRKFFEFGIGNNHLLRTEFESSDGSEYEKKGIHGPINFNSVYVRIWIKQKVFILDSKEGFKKTNKKRSDFKFILGISSKEIEEDNNE